MPTLHHDGDVHLYGEKNFGELLKTGHRLSCFARQSNASYPSYDLTPFRRFEETFDLIPRDEWDERIDEIDAFGGWPEDYCDFECYDQRRTSYGWIHSVAQAMTIKRVMRGLDPVRVSPASMGAPITGYRDLGGWPLIGAKYAAERGGAREVLWPANEINRRYATADAEDDRQNFRIAEWHDCPKDSFDVAATCALLKIPGVACYDWWRHSVCSVRLYRLDGRRRYGLGIRNSWGSIWGHKNDLGRGGFCVLEEGRGTPSDFLAITG